MSLRTNVKEYIMPDDLKALERRFFDEMLNQGNVDAGDDLFAEHSVDYAGFPGQGPGRDGFKQAVRMMHAAFPDIHYTIEDMIAEGDRIATRWTLQGTHRSAFLGVPPTGKQVSVEGIHILRFEDGMVVECWEVWDQLSLLRQLGAAPTQETSASGG
ncbi:MAG: ester cyclase [Thermomicrobiales bacterium]